MSCPNRFKEIRRAIHVANRQNMTYAELYGILSVLTEDQMQCDVTVRCKQTDEFFTVVGAKVSRNDDVLNADHLFLEIDA